MIKALCLCFAACLLFIFLPSCKGKDEPIPSYIQIDSVSVSASGLQGNKIQQISALQVFVDGDLLGIFEIPAVIPAHYTGKHTISLIAVTFLNGSSSQRAVYRPLLIADTTATLTSGSITKFNFAVFKYRPATQFLWTEDFEDANSSVVLKNTEPGDSQLIKTVPFDLKGKFMGNTKALEIQLKGSDTSKYIDVISFNTFAGLPITGTDINLEFDILSPVNVQVALDRISGSVHEYVPFLFLNSTDSKWKRFYLNLVPEIASQPNSNTYKIYFTIYRPSSANGDVKIYLDNIRFCYLP